MLDSLSEYVPSISAIATPLSAVVGWLVGRRKRQLEGISALQDTVNLLIAKNCELIREITDLRQKYAALSAENRELLEEVQRLNKACKDLLNK